MENSLEGHLPNVFNIAKVYLKAKCNGKFTFSTLIQLPSSYRKCKKIYLSKRMSLVIKSMSENKLAIALCFKVHLGYIEHIG